MKQIVKLEDFRNAFERMDRKNNFSYSGLEALFDYLICLEEDLDEENELDVVALCCEWTEYEDIEEFQCNYGDEYQTIEDIEYRTIVIPIDDVRFIIADF